MDRCFACGQALRRLKYLVTCSDEQTAFVGADCFLNIERANDLGWQPPKGGPRLYTLEALKRPERDDAEGA